VGLAAKAGRKLLGPPSSDQAAQAVDYPKQRARPLRCFQKSQLQGRQGLIKPARHEVGKPQSSQEVAVLWRHRVQPNGLLEMIDRDAGVADISTNPTGRTKSRYEFGCKAKARSRARSACSCMRPIIGHTMPSVRQGGRVVAMICKHLKRDWQPPLRLLMSDPAGARRCRMGPAVQGLCIRVATVHGYGLFQQLEGVFGLLLRGRVVDLGQRAQAQFIRLAASRSAWTGCVPTQPASDWARWLPLPGR